MRAEGMDYYLRLLYWEAGLQAPFSLPQEPLKEAIDEARGLPKEVLALPHEALRHFRRIGQALLERAGVPHLYGEVGRAVEKDLEKAVRFP